MVPLYADKARAGSLILRKGNMLEELREELKAVGEKIGQLRRYL